jgi:glucose/mannose transport system permease protein
VNSRIHEVSPGGASLLNPASRLLPRRGRRRRTRPHQIAILIFLVMTALFYCVPLYVIVMTSLKPMNEVRLGDIFGLPHQWTFDSWKYAWSAACSGMRCDGVSGGFFNSLSILLPSLVLSISLAMLTGYAMALWQVKWANGLLFTLFVCAVVPFQIIMYPLIKITGFLSIYGTTFGVAVVHAILALPILTLIFRNFFRSIPAELTAAAMIDSGSFWRIFLEIILPMSGNILIVVLIFQITSVWNDFIVGLTFGGHDAQPMTVILNNLALTDTGENNYSVDMAAALLTAAPPLLIYFFLGRFFVQGITAGALKA